MSILPVARYVIVCNDWAPDPGNPRRVNIYGLLTNIESLDQPPYPLLYPEMCVFLALTEGRGRGDGQIVCTLEGTGQKIFETPLRPITFGPDPLEVVGVSFRIRDCPFPAAGLYLVQFWYNGAKVDERPLRLR
jgi:hypothetical protein